MRCLLLTLFVVSIIIFVGVEFLPGDIAEALLGQGASPENVAALRHELGLDRPAHIRYIGCPPKPQCYRMMKMIGSTNYTAVARTQLDTPDQKKSDNSRICHD